MAVLSEEALYATQPHLQYVELLHRGYLLLDITAERTQAEWHFTPTVSQTTSNEVLGEMLRTDAGSSHLESTDQRSSPRQDMPLPAP